MLYTDYRQRSTKDYPIHNKCCISCASDNWKTTGSRTRRGRSTKLRIIQGALLDPTGAPLNSAGACTHPLGLRRVWVSRRQPRQGPWTRWPSIKGCDARTMVAIAHSLPTQTRWDPTDHTRTLSPLSWRPHHYLRQYLHHYLRRCIPLTSLHAIRSTVVSNARTSWCPHWRNRIHLGSRGFIIKPVIIYEYNKEAYNIINA